MVITVQHVERKWRLVHPLAPTRMFDRGADAFDVAVELAREHHQRTGQAAAVRVEAFATGVKVVRYG